MTDYEDLPSEILTPRLRLRGWTPADAEPHRYLWLERDPRALRRIDEHGRPTVEDLRRWSSDTSSSAGPGLGLMPIELRATGQFIGYCGLIVGQASDDEPELAYELAKRAQGHGYATEAALAMVAVAATTGRRRLWATVREWNAPSIRVLEKVGFHPSGRVSRDSERGDSIWMTRSLY